MAAIELKPDFAEAFNNLAGALGDAGRWGEAAAALMRALAVRPDYAEAHFNLAMQLLIHGDFEARMERIRMADANGVGRAGTGILAAALGRGDPSGKTILLWCEQGLGDAIQFIRYARPLIERGESCRGMPDSAGSPFPAIAGRGGGGGYRPAAAAV